MKARQEGLLPYYAIVDPGTIKERFLASFNGQKQLPEPEKVKTSLVFDDLFEDEDE